MVGLATGAIGVLFSLAPAVSSLEHRVGLHALFTLRGPLPPPGGVAIVSIGESAAARFSLPRGTRDWPRSYHARVIDRLVEEGAAVIAFDLQLFGDGASADDEELANAIGRSKRVVLLQLLERVPGSAQESWRRQDPIPAFANAAAGLAPGPTPDAPLISWFRTFLPTTGGQEIPTLPAVVLQVASARAATRLNDALTVYAPAPQEGGPAELLAYMREMRRRFTDDTSALPRALTRLGLNRRIDDRGRNLARRLVRLYAGNATSYLNFYGPGGICTVRYEVVYDGGASPCPLKDAIVFVGGRSRFDRAGVSDISHTEYARGDGGDLSGVELDATAFANLFTGTALHAPGPITALLTLLGFGFVIGRSTYSRRTRLRFVPGIVSARVEAAFVAVLLAGAYCLAAYALFAVFHVIAPVIVPLAVQLPAALLLGLLAPLPVREEEFTGVSTAGDTSR